MTEAQNQPENRQPGQCSTGSGGACAPCGAWRWLLLIIVAVVAYAVFRQWGGGEPNTPAVPWQSDYDAAMAAAAEQNKPVLLAFSASWCGPCQQMKRTTYHDPEVVALSKQFIPIMQDVDEQPARARQFDISGVPTYLVLTPNGKPVSRFSGARDAADFIGELQDGLKDVQTAGTFTGKLTDAISTMGSQIAASGQPAGHGIVWQDDYAAALAAAAEQNKPVLLAFSASWCGPCQQMKKTTYHAPQAIAAADKYIPVMIDVDEQGELADKYNVSAIPSFVMLKADGTQLKRLVGYLDASEFVAALESGLRQQAAP